MDPNRNPNIHVVESPPRLYVSTTGDDVNEGSESRPKRTIQAAVDSLGTTATHRAGTLVVVGHHLLTTTLVIDRRTLYMDGVGWETLTANSRGTILEWGGAAGVPMIEFTHGNWGGGMSRMHILGSTTSRPSSVIHMVHNSTSPTPNALLRFEDLFIGPMSGYDSEIALDYADNGILFESDNNTNNDMSVWDNIYVRRATTGVNLTHTQAVGHDFRKLHAINCGTGFENNGARVMGSNWYFLSNRTQDIYVHNAGHVVILRFASESGFHFAKLGDASTSGFLHILGGQWQRAQATMDATGLIVDGVTNSKTVLDLQEFEFTSVGSPPTPILSMKSAAAGASEHRFVAKNVSNIDNTWLDMPLISPANTLDRRHIEIERTSGPTPSYFYMRNILKGGGGNTTIDPARYDLTDTIHVP